MKTRVASAFVARQAAKVAYAQKSNLRAYKVRVETIVQGKVTSCEDRYFAEAKVAHSFATKAAKKNCKATVFENAGGETYVLLGVYEIDPVLLARPPVMEARMNLAKRMANDVAVGATHTERWLDAARNTKVPVLVRKGR